MVWKDEMLCLLSVLTALFITPDPSATPQAIAGFSYKCRGGSGLDPQIPYQAYKAQIFGIISIHLRHFMVPLKIY